MIECVQREPDASVFTASWDEIDASGTVTGRVEAAPWPQVLPCAFRSDARRPTVPLPRWSRGDRQGGVLRSGDACLRRLACVGADGRGGLPLRRGPRGPRARPLASGIALEALSHDVGKRQASAGECCQGCPICGRARARGLARWREWCYVSMLAPRLRSQFAQRNYLGAARQALSALATIPSLWCSCSDWPGPEAMLAVAPASPSEQHRDRAGVGTDAREPA